MVPSIEHMECGAQQDSLDGKEILGSEWVPLGKVYSRREEC